MDIESIIKSLGKSKITQPIIVNKYEESYKYIPTFNYFDNMIVIKDNSNKQSSIKDTNYIDRTRTIHQVNKVKPQQHSLCKGILSLWKLLAYIDDSTISLYDDKTQYTKVIQYKDKVMKDLYIKQSTDKNLKNINIESLDSDCNQFMKYMAYHLNANVFDVANTKLYNCISDNIYIIEYNNDLNIYNFKSGDVSLKDVYRIICVDLDKKLVKDIKDIAISLNIEPIKIIEGKKKPLLKSELLRLIREKL